MKKRYLFLFLAFVFKALPAKAVCPVCTIAVGAGVGLSRYLGIDDTIAGVWIGGLLVSVSLWTIGFLKKKEWRFKFSGAIVFLFYILIIIVPLYVTNIMGHPLNKFWGVDRLLLGIIIGGISFWFSAYSYFWLKKRNGGKPNFPFQKVAMTVAALVVWSGIFYFLTR